MRHNQRRTLFCCCALIGTPGLMGSVRGAILDSSLINDFSGIDVSVSEVRDGAGGSTTTLTLFSGSVLGRLDVFDGSRVNALSGSRITELRAFDTSVSTIQAGATIASINTFETSIVTNRSDNQVGGDLANDDSQLNLFARTSAVNISGGEHGERNIDVMDTSHLII